MAEIFYTTLQFGCWRSFTGAHLQIDEDIKDRNTNESLQISMTSSSLGTICTAKNLFWAYQLSYQIKGFLPGPRAFYIYLSPFSTFRCIFFHFYIPAQSLKLCKHVFCKHVFAKSTVTFISTLSHSQSHSKVNWSPASIALSIQGWTCPNGCLHHENKNLFNHRPSRCYTAKPLFLYWRW